MDTSFLVGAASGKDAHHVAARGAQIELAAGRWGQALLHEYVLLETTSVMLKRAGLEASQALGQSLLSASEFVFVPCGSDWPGAWSGFMRQRTTALSLTDIAVTQLAVANAGGKVLGFDQEFRKVPGITLLPATR